MNSNLAFVQWTRKNFPTVFQAALTKAQRKVALGGLGDDLLSDITFDPNSLSISDGLDYSSASSYNPAGAGISTSSSGTNWSGIIDSIAKAIPSVAGGVVQTKAQWDLINTNSALAQRGLPLQSSLLTPNPIQQNSMLILGILGLGVVALALGGRGTASSSSKK